MLSPAIPAPPSSSGEFRSAVEEGSQAPYRPRYPLGDDRSDRGVAARRRAEGGAVSTDIVVAEPAPSFAIPPSVAALRDRVAELVRAAVYPREGLLRRPGDLSWEIVQELRAAAREAGVYGPHLPTGLDGLGLDWRGVAVLFEEAGTSLLGPLALNGAAPDEGNMHLLEKIATSEQRDRYLAPLAAGTVRSCFAMTEPAPGAGSDPAMLRTRARRDGGGWVIDGHKWYITGADGAAFAIVMARTADDPDPRRGATMFLVDSGTPGFDVVRHIGSLDQTFAGGHCEVRLTGCRVPDDAILGVVDEGFRYAQVRLAPAR